MYSAADSVFLLKLAERAVRVASIALLQELEKLKTTVKDLEKDIKIEADRKMEEIIINQLSAETGYPFLSEEAGLVGGINEGGYCWIIDPLDGSLNFSRGIPICCISIGLWHKGDPFLGVIFDFNRNECFSGVINEGAWLNGERIKTSSVSKVNQAVLLTGFPSATDFSTDSISVFIEGIKEFKKVRLLGSAALSLAYVACGRADFYRENDIKKWDIAAGLAVVKAAGGRISCRESVVSDNTMIVEASNGYLLQHL